MPALGCVTCPVAAGVGVETAYTSPPQRVTELGVDATRLPAESYACIDAVNGRRYCPITAMAVPADETGALARTLFVGPSIFTVPPAAALVTVTFSLESA